MLDKRIRMLIHSLLAQSRFHPEVLGMNATAAFLIVISEFAFIKTGCYLLSIASESQFLDIMAYSGYKFIGYGIFHWMKRRQCVYGTVKSTMILTILQFLILQIDSNFACVSCGSILGCARNILLRCIYQRIFPCKFHNLLWGGGVCVGTPARKNRYASHLHFLLHSFGLFDIL